MFSNRLIFGSVIAALAISPVLAGSFGVFQLGQASTGLQLPASATLIAIDGEQFPGGGTTSSVNATQTLSYFTRNGYTYAANGGFNTKFLMGSFGGTFGAGVGDNDAAVEDLGWNFIWSTTGFNETTGAANGVFASKEAASGGPVTGTFGNQYIGFFTQDEPSTYAIAVSGPISQTTNTIQDGRFWWVNWTHAQLGFPQLNGGGGVSGIPGDGTTSTAVRTSVATPNATTRHIDFSTVDFYFITGSYSATWGFMVSDYNSGTHAYQAGSFQDLYNLPGAPQTFPATITTGNQDQCQRISHYGDMMEQWRNQQQNFVTSPSLPFYPAPAFGIIETGQPFGLMGSTDTGTGNFITAPQLWGAAWASLVHGARGFVWFGNTLASNGDNGGYDALIDSGNATFYGPSGNGIYPTMKILTNLINSPLSTVLLSPWLQNYATVSPGRYVFPTPSFAVPNAGSGAVDISAKWFNGNPFTWNGLTFNQGAYILANYAGSLSDSALSVTYTITNTGSSSVTKLNAAMFLISSQSSTQITVSWVAEGTITNGMPIYAPGLGANTTIVSQASGTTGKAGVYNVSVSGTAANAAAIGTESISVSGGTSFTDTIEGGTGIGFYKVN